MRTEAAPARCQSSHEVPVLTRCERNAWSPVAVICLVILVVWYVAAISDELRW